jgi:transcriptional regulator with XRE-family HTH domain
MIEQDLFAMVGKKVREFRKNAGLTQKEVAEKAKVHQSDLATFEKRGEKIKGLDIIARIVEATGHTMTDLFTEPEKKTTFTASSLSACRSSGKPRRITRCKTALSALLMPS